MHLTIDFETLSAVTELPKTGVWPYAEHPSTDVWCLALKVDNYTPVVWVPPWVSEIIGRPHSIPYEGPMEHLKGQHIRFISNEELTRLIVAADIIEAHNSEFERVIWWYVMSHKYNLPNLDFYKIRCSAAKAAMHGLPRKLEGACDAMQLPVQKDSEGHTLTLQMCKPRAPRKDEREELTAKYGERHHFAKMMEAYDSAKKDKLKAMCAYAAANWHECRHYMLWQTDPGKILRNILYCVGDVEAEYCLSQSLQDLPPLELAIWQHDQIVNMRGVPVDLQMVESALGLIEENETRLLREMEELTGGKVKSPRQVAAGLAWLDEHGCTLENMQKATVAAALKNDGLQLDAKRFLEIRAALSKSSTAKYQAAKMMVCSDGRIRSISMYHGASTGRWTHKGMQLGNLPRGDKKIVEDELTLGSAVQDVKNGNLDVLMDVYDDPLNVLSSVIRTVLRAEQGHELTCSDFSSVEGRGLAYLAGEQWVLDEYAKGRDMYKVAASAIYGCTYEEVDGGGKGPMRFTGKTAELACGYFGGPGAIAAFGGKCPKEDRPKWVKTLLRKQIHKSDAHNLKLFDDYAAQAVSEEALKLLVNHGFKYPTEEEIFEAWAKDVVRKWRQSRPATVKLWHELDRCSLETVRTGQPHSYRDISFQMAPNDFLTCRLPNGRLLYYHRPRTSVQETKWGERKLRLSSKTVDGTTKKYVRRGLHGGILTENIVQAFCRDILAEAMLRLENAGYPVAFHVHDEVISHHPAGFGSLQQFDAIMSQVPTWAHGMPIGSGGWRGHRYHKD